MVTVGQIAPDFKLLNQNGECILLSQLRGKNVILFAFPSAQEYSYGCTAQACAFRDEFPQIEAGNALVFGISPDGVEQMKKWHKGRKLQYDLLSDPDHTMLEPYGAWGIPMMGLVRVPMVNRSYWLIDTEGVIRDMQINVRPGESVTKAVAALERLNAAQSQPSK